MKFQKLWLLKMLSLSLSKSINSLKFSETDQLKFLSSTKKSNKLNASKKKWLPLKTDRLKLKKLFFTTTRLLKKKHLSPKKMLFLTFKTKFKSLIDMRIESSPSHPQLKRLLKSHTFLKRSSRKLSLCHKLLKSWNMFMKFVKKKV